MSADIDDAERIIEAVTRAARDGTPLELRGSGSKRFYGRMPRGEPLELGSHRGVLAYEPSELVVTARAGTPLEELDARLAASGQMMPWEPPRFGGGGTLGGAVACGLSGPRRPWVGAARDFVLGVECVNGRGERLRFGGEVMKNVAGYDLSRLMVGALGTLGVLLSVSQKVLPLPEREVSLARGMTVADALAEMSRLSRTPLPVAGACHLDGVLRIRLAGSAQGVSEAQAAIGGDEEPDGAGFWARLRDLELPFFTRPGAPLWRVSVPPATAGLELAGAGEAETLIDWGGAQRWLRFDGDAASLRAAAARAGGHATRFRGDETARGAEVFTPLPEAVMALHRRLKQALDPEGIFNPGRLYAGL